MQTQPLTDDLKDGHAKLANAVLTASIAHAAQVRKGTTIPYISHLLQVAGLVLEFGGDFNQAVAGVLHDAVEDTSTKIVDIRGMFGERVAEIVEACTDTDESDAPAQTPQLSYTVGRTTIEPGSCPFHSCMQECCPVHGKGSTDGWEDILYKSGYVIRGAAAPTGAKVKAPWKVRKSRYLEKLATVTPDAALVIACDKLHNMRCQIADLSFGGETVKFNAPLADRMWLQGAMLEALRPKLSPRMLAALAETTRELELMQDFAPAGQRDAFIAAGMETT